MSDLEPIIDIHGHERRCGISVSAPVKNPRIGRLTAIGRPFGSWRRKRVVVECDCGNVLVVLLGNIQGKKPNTMSCGCHRIAVATARLTTHGMAGTKRYLAYKAMVNRCHNHGNHAYKDYGARGITVCDHWRASFEAYLQDTGECPGPGYSLDRIDNNRGYSPDNVRWATKAEQSRNKRSNLLLTFYGKTMCVADWAKISQVSASAICKRLKGGMEATLAVWTPPGATANV